MLWVLGTGKTYTETSIIGFPMALLLVTIPRIGVREPEPINTLQNVHDVRVPSNASVDAGDFRVFRPPVTAEAHHELNLTVTLFTALNLLRR